MTTGEKTQNLLCVAMGVAGLLFSRTYSGPMAAILHGYGANVTFSFGAYFILKFFRLPLKKKMHMNAAYTLIGVSAQEVAQAMALYPGTFDALDFLANAVGIGVAWGVDVWLSKRRQLRGVSLEDSGFQQ
jgi:hypothetical protein